MKTILYVGSLRPGDNGEDRANIFEKCGYKVVGMDRHQYLNSGMRAERSMASRFMIGRSVTKFNRDLMRYADREDFDVVFIDKGVWIWPRTTKYLKERSRGNIIIHYTPDFQFLANKSRHFRKSLPFYDLCITTKKSEVRNYHASGAKNLMLIEQGYGARLCPVPCEELQEEFLSDVCFVGHLEPYYAEVLEELSRVVDVKIWGPGWTKFARRSNWAAHCVQGEGLFGKDYSRALSGAKIALGLLSKRVPDVSTTRTFEIPACRTLLMAEHTQEHVKLFEPGVEAVFFRNFDELFSLTKHYLNHADERERIASSGYARCIASGYSLEAQFQKIVDWLDLKLTA